MDVAQALSTKAFAMKNMSKLNNTVRLTTNYVVLATTALSSQPSNILRTRAAQLEQYCSELEAADVDTGSAHKLNEYAVLLTLFGDSR